MQHPGSAKLVFGAALVLGFLACHKGPSFGPLEGDDELSRLFKNNRANSTQTFQVSASNGGVIVGDKGVRITFGPDAFRRSDGTTVSGTVQVSLLEVMDVKDMVWLNVQTVGNDNGMERLLKSGGAVRISATQGGQELVLGPSGLRLQVPTDSFDLNMGVFSASSIAEDGMIWNADTTIPIDSTALESPSGWTFGYDLQVDSLQWINCDHFPGYPMTTDLIASTPSDVANDSTRVWAIFPTDNSVAGMGAFSANTFAFAPVPAGFQVTVVGLTRHGGSYRSAFTTVTIAQGMSIGLDFQPTTLQAFETALDNL